MLFVGEQKGQGKVELLLGSWKHWSFMLNEHDLMFAF